MPTRWTSGVLLALLTAAPLAGQTPQHHPQGGPRHAPAAALTPPARVALPDAGATAPIQMASGRPVVEAMVNGRGPLRLLVETGSPITILTLRAARRIGLAPDSGMNRRLVRLDSVDVGQARLTGFNALVFDRLPGPVDGLLGLNAFADLLLTIDYPAGVLRLSNDSLPAPDGREVLRASRAGPFWSVELEVAGRRMPAVLDTQASSGFAVTPVMADSLRFATPPAVVGRARGPSVGDVERRVGRLDEDVMVGSTRFERPLVDIIPMPPMLAYPVLMGTRALQQFAFSLDQRHERARLARSSADPVPAPPPLRGFGFSAPHAEDGFRRIAHVMPGSPADTGGVKAGDEVVAADGKAAAGLTEAEFTALADLDRPVRFRLRRESAEREVTLAPVLQVR
jgi:predicted aspartyl protease